MSKILIVEDNKIAASQAKRMFMSIINAEIMIASCGEDALEIFKENIFNVIIMDIGLGEGIDGAETTKRMRDIEAELGRSRCPIFALTAHSIDPNILAHHANMGLDKTYNKPASQEIIEEIMDAVPSLKKNA